MFQCWSARLNLRDATCRSLGAVIGGISAALFRRFKRISMQGIPPELDEFQTEGISLGWRALKIATAITTASVGTL